MLVIAGRTNCTRSALETSQCRRVRPPAKREPLTFGPFAICGPCTAGSLEGGLNKAHCTACFLLLNGLSRERRTEISNIPEVGGMDQPRKRKVTVQKTLVG